MTLGPVLSAALAAQAACEKLGLSFCVIGGVALQRWGEPRFTADADISVLVEPGEELRIADALALGATRKNRRCLGICGSHL